MSPVMRPNFGRRTCNTSRAHNLRDNETEEERRNNGNFSRDIYHEPIPSGSDDRRQNRRYPKTSGSTPPRGHEYEVALCCLIFLRALRLASDFFISYSNAHCGKLDDVVMFYRPKGDESLKFRAILLQAKHMEKIKQKELTASYPFKLKEYLASFKTIRNLWNQPLMVQSRLVEFQEISLVLYTNTSCVIDDVAHDVTDSADAKHLRDILNTGGRLLRILDAEKAGLPQGKETSHFIKNLILCIKQTSAEKADQVLEEEIREVLKLTSSKDAKELLHELKLTIMGWRREEGEGRYLTAQSVEWERVLELQVRRLNNDTLTIQSYLNLDFTKAALEEMNCLIGHEQSWIIVRDKYQGTTTRVRLLKALRTYLVLDANFLKSHFGEVDAVWGTAVCPILTLDISGGSLEEASELLQSLQTAILSQAGRTLVVIAKEKPTKPEWFVLDAVATWSLLHPAAEERLLNVQVDLQGKVVPLRDVVGLEASSIMSDKVIHSLCDPAEEAMKLGVPLPPPHEYYVPRCMERRSLKEINIDIWKNTNTILFPKGAFELKFIAKYISKIMYLQNLVAINDVRGKVLLGQKCSDTEIRLICSKFCARGISGDFGEEGLVKKVKEFFPSTWMCDEKVLMLDGVPGVGKSSFVTEMCSSVKERFPDSWVLRVDMGKHTEFIQERDFRRSSDITAFLLRDVPKDPHCLGPQLLEHALYVTGNVFLFLDAFDEISPDYTDKCCDLLKGIATTVRYRQLVVTTRPVTSKVVEEALGTKAFNLPVFSEDEQNVFLELFCKTKGKNVDDKEISPLRQAAGSVLEIPLLLKMTAEILLRRDDQILLKYQNPWRKILLHQIFVKQSINDRLAEKLGLHLSMPGVKRLLESNSNEHLQNLQSMAVRKLMPVSQLSTLNVSSKVPDEKLGLVVDNGGSLDFEHQSFAEYFLGCWLAHHWQRCPPQVLREVLTRDGNEFVAATLSWSLFEGFPLHEAVAQGDEDEVRALLSSGGTTDRDRGGRSALHVAAMTTQGKHDKVVELLIAAGEDPFKKDDILGSNAVLYAEIFGNWKFVEVMLEKDETLDCLTFCTDQNAAKEVLIESLKQGRTKLFHFILRLHEGITHHRLDDKGNTLLHLAAANNNTGIVKVLIEMNHDVNFQNYDGNTPLHESSISGHLEVVNFLLQNGANPNILNENGRTTLMLAVLQGHLEVAKLLMEMGAGPNLKTENGQFSLMLAAFQGDFEVVKLLVEMGADPNLKSEDGTTALMSVAHRGHLDVVKLLVKMGADPNLKSEDGTTALMGATAQDHLDVAKILIDMGADPNLKAKDGVTALMWAAAKGHLEIVRLLICMGGDINLKAEDGVTVLMAAADQGHLEVVKLLIDKGANPNIKKQNGVTALITAAFQGHLEVVKLLIEMGALINLKAEGGQTALMGAAVQCHPDIVKLLIEKGADAHAKDDDGETALMKAAAQGHLEVVKLLIVIGGDPLIVKQNGLTALMGAAFQGHLEVVKLLLEMGMVINLKAEDGVTAMMAAAHQGHLEVVKLLLEAGVNPNIKKQHGSTALRMAAFHGHLEVVRLLLEMGADINLKAGEGVTVLMTAAHQGHLEVVKLLIDKGANPNVRKPNGVTALLMAAFQGHLEVVKLLIEMGADPNLKAEDGETALMRAAAQCDHEVVKLLIDKGTDPNAQKQNGVTALLMAASHGHLEVVKVLIEKGADPAFNAEDGVTALMVAAGEGHLEVVKLLIEKGADPNFKTKDGETALLGAAGEGHFEVVKVLLEKGADPHLMCEDGETALMRASGEGHLEVVKLLIDNGADPNTKKQNGHTALMGAASKGHLEVMNHLLENGADQP